MNNGPYQKQNLLVWWILWAAFLIGVVQIYYFLGAKISSNTKPSLLLAATGIIPFVISGIIRWIILPRIRVKEAAFPIYIIGIAFAEACCFLGLFILPAYKLEFFVISILGILQFIPVFAGKYFRGDK